MTVILNEAALQFLLESPAGPTGQMLERTANVVAGNAEAVAALIIEEEFLRPNVSHDVVVGDEGLAAIVGIPFEGRISGWMAQKWEREADQIVPALMSNWNSQI